MQIKHDHRQANKSYRFDFDDSVLMHEDNEIRMHLIEVGNTIVTRVEGKGGTSGIEMFEGLPNNMCQSAHWGFVVKGKVRIHTPEGALDCVAGDAYYQAVPHRVEWVEDSVLIEYSPREEFWVTQEALEENAKKQ